MKEIDFTPEWYKTSQRRQSGYRRQYAVLGCIVVIMAVWNYITAGAVSRAQADIERATEQLDQLQPAQAEFARLQRRVSQMSDRAGLLGKMDSRMDVAGVLAEISFLIDRTIVLKKVEMTAQAFETERSDKPRGSSVRPASAPGTAQYAAVLGAVRFKIALSGLAVDASDVAELVRRFEGSAYFTEVGSKFRNRQLNTSTGATKREIQVTEFEIGCYLANYTQAASGAADSPGRG